MAFPSVTETDLHAGTALLLQAGILVLQLHSRDPDFSVHLHCNAVFLSLCPISYRLKCYHLI